MGKFSELTPGQKVVIIAATITGFAAIFAALIGLYGIIYQTNKPIKVAQTAEAKLTASALTSALTPANILQPSGTFVNAVTLTPMQTLTPALTITSTSEPSRTLELLERSTTTPTFTDMITLTSTPTPIPVTPLPFFMFFTQCKENAFLNGEAILNVNPGCDDAQKESAIQLVWMVPNNLSNTGCTISLDPIAEYASNNEALVFWARSKYPNEQISIKIKDDKNEESRLIKLSTEWQQVVLPLLYDFPGINVQKIQALTIGIDYDNTRQDKNGEGAACFRNFGFGTP
jgi:hypothetical protein